MRSMSAFLLLAATSGAALAAPVTYELDPRHTSPSFEADHFGGLSVWRGKFTGTTGTIVLDRAAGTGTVNASLETATLQTGLADLDKHVKSNDFLDVEKFPTATYKGKITKFKDGVPLEVQGDLTLHGVTKPLTLTVRSFKCMPHPMKPGNEVCGADAHGTINREDFGMTWGKNFGFDMKVGIELQVEALAPVK